MMEIVKKRKNWCRLTIAPGITDEEFFQEIRDAN